MFLLLLMGLGAAGVKAQVRIGGNVAPNAATVLDLNTNNNANPAGNKGLGLPRVTLVNDTTMLTPGVANLNGMVVCNTTNTLGGVGLYYWSANSAKWVKVNLPPTSAADSGKALMSNGITWVPANPLLHTVVDCLSVNITLPGVPATWTKILDTALTFSWRAGEFIRIAAPGIKYNDVCRIWGAWGSYFANNSNERIMITDSYGSGGVVATRQLTCYRPSI